MTAAEINQCDGCRVGAPLNAMGIHRYTDGSLIACTRDRYAAEGTGPPFTVDEICELAYKAARENARYWYEKDPNAECWVESATYKAFRQAIESDRARRGAQFERMEDALQQI